MDFNKGQILILYNNKTSLSRLCHIYTNNKSKYKIIWTVNMDSLSQYLLKIIINNMWDCVFVL